VTLSLFPDHGKPKEPPKPARPTLYMVDGPNIAYRAHYALPGLTNNQGDPTGALYGYCLMLFKLLKEHQPDYLVLVWDPRGGTFRNEIYADYKGTRPDMPEELRRQIQQFPTIADALGIKHYVLPGYEADDVLGTLAERLKDRVDVTIVTGDKDMMQLVDGDRVTLLDTMKNLRVGPQQVFDKWGVPPEHIVDILALMGDTSDNIPGVRGIGKKGAAQLIQEWGTVENIFDHLDEVTGRSRKPLSAEDARADAMLSKRLATIELQAPVDLVLEDFSYSWPPVDRVPVRRVFMELEFNNFLTDLGGDMQTLSRDRYRTVTTEEALRDAVRRVRAAERPSFDVAVTPDGPGASRIVGIALCADDAHVWYVPLGHSPQAGLSLQVALPILGDLFGDPAVPLLGHDVKSAHGALMLAGVDLLAIGGDTRLTSFLLNAARRTHKLEDHALSLLGHKMGDREALTKAAEGAENLAVADAAALYGERAHVVHLLHPRLHETIVEGDLDSLYRELELPLIPVVSRMERRGIRVDVELLTAYGVELAADIAVAQTQVYELAGEEFNVGSPKQLRRILFDKLALPVVKKTKTGPSTDHSVLEELATHHDLPAAIIRWRSLSKLKSTYVDALPPLVHPRTGRIHTHYKLTGAETGRISSDSPNLQNIPIRTPEGRRIRQAFIAADGCVLMSADYSQVELRVLAHLCGGKGGFAQAFSEGKDIHRVTASEVFDVAEALVTDEMRRSAKAINFGLVYGQGAFGLSKVLHIPRREAAKYIRRYKKQYPEVDEYMNRIVEFASKNRYVETLMGRRRPILDLSASNYNKREAAKRIAINTPVQGSAADIIRVAMLRVDAMLQAEFPEVGLLLQVHDELVLEVPHALVDRVRSRVVEAMESARELIVPLKVDVGVGMNWQEAH
jgi:DNA polymerase-1